MGETMKPPMFYAEGEKWGGRYIGYSVFIAHGLPYMYLGVDTGGYHSYVDLSGYGTWYYSSDTHLPQKTFKLMNSILFDEHRSSLKIGCIGTNYEKHNYIITHYGRLFRYFGKKGDKFSYRDMSAKRADGTYREVLCDYKLENKAIQFTL